MASDVIETHRCTSPLSFKYVGKGFYQELRVEFLLIFALRYKLSLMKPSIKPLGIALKVSLRIDDTGLLCFQFMIKVEDNHNCYIDFYVSSLFSPYFKNSSQCIQLYNAFPLYWISRKTLVPSRC